MRSRSVKSVAFFSLDAIARAEFRLLRSVRVIMGAKRRTHPLCYRESMDCVAVLAMRDTVSHYRGFACPRLAL